MTTKNPYFMVQEHLEKLFSWSRNSSLAQLKGLSARKISGSHSKVTDGSSLLGYHINC